VNLQKVSFCDLESARGQIKYLHDGNEIGSTAFELSTFAEISVLLPRYVGVVSVFADIFDESFSECVATVSGSFASSDMITDEYSLNLDTKSLGVGLYFFRLRIECAVGTVYGYKSANKLVFSECENSSYDAFQLSVVSFPKNSPKKYAGGIIYHVFVDRFARGGDIKPRRDAVMLSDWEGGIPEYPAYPGAHLENNTFFGGTLIGVKDKLEYISSLGVNLIYLSPIFEAYSNHKYDTGNYMKVDAMFGGDEALVELISEAKKYGIEIILDGVFNHTGADSIYFNKYGRYKTLGAYQSKDSEYYSWYDFKNYPEKYTCWWDIDILPRINPDKKACGEYIAGKGGVIEKYADLGIAGFRLDVADELSDEFLAKIRARLSSVNKSSILYGEVWEDASNKIAYGKRKKYYLGRELDAVMNYPLRVGIIDFLKNRSVKALEYALFDVTMNAPKRVRDLQMNLLGTHDTERIITMLAGDSAEGKSNDMLAVTFLSKEQKEKGKRLLKMAYTALATLPGIPAIFYGDEVGLEGYKDPFNRRPYPWKSADEEIREFYRRVGKIRRGSSVYRDGDFKIHILNDSMLIFSRTKGDNAYITVLNNSDNVLTLAFKNSAKELVSQKRKLAFSIEPLSAAIFKTDINNTIKII